MVVGAILRDETRKPDQDYTFGDDSNDLVAADADEQAMVGAAFGIGL